MIVAFLFLASTGSAIENSQLLPTNLKITIVDGLGNNVEGATVKLYKTEEDYLNSENPIAEETTNNKGVVKFKKLETIAYYIEVRKGEMSNDGKGAQVAPLEEGRTNQVNIVIE